jgi:cation-transporting ATPase E
LSCATFTGRGTWVLGAPELVLPASQHEVLSRAANLAASGRRVLVIGRAPAAQDVSEEAVPPGVQPVALIVLAERLRADAQDAIEYFKTQGVALKVISGDSPRTVAAVAAQSGVPLVGDPVDARNLPEDGAALGALLEGHSVFGRVTPHQKQAMIKALQARGHTVAMTGDGVNDVLALKLADLGVAVGSAAPATRAVAELVLLDGRFAALPRVMAEGRRVTANIERVASLFLTKTVWATLLAIAAGMTLLPFPFLPRHLTIIDTVAIGVPSYFLALASNTRRYLPGFAGRVLRFAVPAGVVVAAAAFATFYLTRAAGMSPVHQQTATTIVTTILSLAVLVLLATPLTWRRILLIAAVAAGFMLLFLSRAVRQFYALDLPQRELGLMLVVTAIGAVMLAGLTTWSRRSGPIG